MAAAPEAAVRRRRLLGAAGLLLLAAAGPPRHAAAQTAEGAALAAELVALKGGYVARKRLLEDVRLRAYVPILLKAVGKGPEWNPAHRNWRALEQRIAEDWFRLNAELARSLGRDTSYEWFDAALAREYARAFSAGDLRQLIAFYGSAEGRALVVLEAELLRFYPDSLVQSLGRALVGSEPLSGRAQELFRTEDSRARRDFVALFETETVIREESVRVGGSYVEASYPAVQQDALAAAAERIDALRRSLPEATLAALRAYAASELGRRERAFLARTVPVALPGPEDPQRTREAEARFYAGLETLSAQWRALAAQ
jgi:hypothetical protein